jgi:hypothetical protein
MMSIVCRLRAAVVALSMFAGLSGFAFTQPPSSSSSSQTATSTTATATTTTASTLAFSASDDAVGIYDNGTWDAANLITEDLPFVYLNTDKTSYVSIQGRELSASASGFSFYGAGLAYTPYLGFMDKTTIGSDKLGLTVSAAIGNKIYTSGTNSHVAGLFNVTTKYRVSSTVSFNTLQFGALVAPGGTSYYISSGMTKYF